MQTISIMGCGWLGLPLAEFLLKKGYKVKGSTTRQKKLSILEEKGIEGYLLRAGEHSGKQNTSEFFQGDILILNIPPGGRRDPEAAKKHPDQIKRVIETAFHAGVKKLLFIGSTGVYGASHQGIVSEEDTPIPTTASGKALMAIENWLQTQTDLNVTILRFSGLVGGDRKAGRFLAGKKNVPNGTRPVNLIHRKDCIRIIFEILRQERWQEVFNAAADGHPSRQEFYIHQALKLNLQPPSFATPDEKLEGKIISNVKLKEMLGYTFQYPDPMEF